MKNKKKIVLLIIVFCVILTIAASQTFSKYIYNSIWGYYLRSKGFYFSSDSLNVNNKKNSILTWDGNDVIFKIKNSDNDNLVSEYDISYTVSCEILNEEKEYLSCNLNNTDQSTYSGKLSSASTCIDIKGESDVSNLIKSKCELSGYSWKTEEATKDVSFNIELKDETKIIDEVSVQITVESTQPYKKTLKGVFNLNLTEEMSEYELDYEIFDSHSEITIVNKGNYDKCFNISFDETKNLYDNYSNDVIESFVTKDKVINKIKVKIKSQSSTIISFYKLKSEDVYSIEDFILEEVEC